MGLEMSMTVAERTVLIESIQEALAQGTLEVGEAVRRLRVEVTGLHQTQSPAIPNPGSSTTPYHGSAP